MDRYHKWMNFSAIFVLCLFIGVLLIQIFFIIKDNSQMKARLEDSLKKKETLIKENEDYEKQLEYLSSEKNIEKELKSKFNYKRPGEEMIIINQ